MKPQQYTVPVERRAHVNWSPQATWVMLVSDPARTGVPVFVLPPFPSWPEMFSPQHQT